MHRIFSHALFPETRLKLQAWWSPLADWVCLLFFLLLVCLLLFFFLFCLLPFKSNSPRLPGILSQDIFWKLRISQIYCLYSKAFGNIFWVFLSWELLEFSLIGKKAHPLSGLPMKIQMSETTAAILEMVCQCSPVSMHHVKQGDDIVMLVMSIKKRL